MGSSITKLLNFKKSPDVYKKELEGINQEISTAEKKKASLECQYHLIMKFIVTYSALLYFMITLVFFFSTLPSTFVEYVLFCGPIAMFHFLVWGLKKSLKWYFSSEINRYIEMLQALQFRKKSILLEVKEKIKFKEAKDIFEEYSAPNKLDKNI